MRERAFVGHSCYSTYEVAKYYQAMWRLKICVHDIYWMLHSFRMCQHLIGIRRTSRNFAMLCNTRKRIFVSGVRVISFLLPEIDGGGWVTMDGSTAARGVIGLKPERTPQAKWIIASEIAANFFAAETECAAGRRVIRHLPTAIAQ